MDDILSGGKIDQSTSGPTPPNRDDRDRDILLEQKERQDQDAIGGTRFPPKPQPPPPIPEAPEVAPPLPVVPFFDFNISGSALEEFREISRQTTMDILKNVNINGQGPSFEGSSISFNIPQQPPASEAFIFQGIMVPQPLPQVQPIQPTVLPLAQPETAQEIQSFVVSPPSRQQIPQESRTETTEEPQQPAQPRPIEGKVEQAPQAQNETLQPPPTEFPEARFLEPAQAPTTIIESDVVRPPIEISTEPTAPEPEQPRQQPTQLQQEPERESQQESPQPRSVASGDFGTGGKEGFLKPAYTSLSGEKPEDGSQEIRDETRKRGADIDFYDTQVARDEARKAGADIDFDDAQAARDRAREDGAVARGFKEAEDRRDARREADPNFDRESSIRQRGESPKEFRERQEELKKERSEEEKQTEILKRAREGDISELPSGMVPVRLTRADGQKKILALMATEFVGVVEGAGARERTTSLPATDSYYEGGGGGEAPSHPWKITIRTIQDSDPPEYEYAVESGSRLFDGFGGNEVEVIGADGVFRNMEEGYYFIEVDFSDGDVNQAQIQINEEMGSLIETEGDPPIQTKLRQQIGYVFFDDNGIPQLRQNAWHNYSLFQTCRDSVPIKVTVAT